MALVGPLVKVLQAVEGSWVGGTWLFSSLLLQDQQYRAVTVMTTSTETCLLQCVLMYCSDVVPLTRETRVVWICCSQKFGESLNLCTVLRVPENGSYQGSLFML